MLTGYKWLKSASEHDIIYNVKNWSTDTKTLKASPEAYKRWKIEQLINFGLGKEKLNAGYLKKHFNELTIDPKKKLYLSFILWPPQASRKHKKNS